MTKALFKVHETIHRIPLAVRVGFFGVSVGLAVLAWFEIMERSTRLVSWNLI